MKMDALRNLTNDDRSNETAKDGRDKAMGAAVQRGSGTRAPLGVPQNYIPLPEGHEYVEKAYAYMSGAGRSLYKQWVSPSRKLRLQDRNLPTSGDEWNAQKREWLRQTGRRRFSSFTPVQELGLNYATNESAQAAYSQRQLNGRPHSEKQFYAFLRGMSALFGSLE